MSQRVVNLNSRSDRTELPIFNGMRVLAVVISSDVKEHILKLTNDLQGVEVAFAAGGTTPLQALRARSDVPDAMLIEGIEVEQTVIALRELRSTMEGKRIYVCVLSENQEEGPTTSLFRAGADDILSVTPSPTELGASLARAGTSQHRGHDGSGAGGLRTLAFMHASGGAGATTLAVNSAVYLQSLLKDTSQVACLLDMDLQFGTIDLQLDLPVRSRVVDLIKMPERLDSLMLRELTVDGPEGLRVLTAPEMLLPVDALDYRTVEAILVHARRDYRFVIVDMPHVLTTWTDVVLRRADRVYMVTQMNVMALRETRRLLDTLKEEGIDPGPIRIVANRYPAKGAGKRIGIAEAEDALGMPVYSAIPSDFPLIVESLDFGLPAYKRRPNSKFSRAIEEMVHDFTNDMPGASKKRGGLFGLGR